MSDKKSSARDLPGDLLDDGRSWQGDHDPYLANLAHEGRKYRVGPVPRGLRVEGPLDDGDPYLAQLARNGTGRDAG
jgi:hypothetical protein